MDPVLTAEKVVEDVQGKAASSNLEAFAQISMPSDPDFHEFQQLPSKTPRSHRLGSIPQSTVLVYLIRQGFK